MPFIRSQHPYELVQLSKNEQNLLAMMKRSPDNPSFVISKKLHIRGPLDVPLLNLVYQAFLRSQRNTRATYHQGIGRTEKRIHPRDDISVQRFSVGDGSELHWLQNQTRNLLIPERLPLVALSVIEHGPDEYTVVGQFNHLIGDGWSGATLWTFIAECYGIITRFDPLFRYASLFWQPLTDQLRRLALRFITSTRLLKRLRYREVIAREQQLEEEGALTRLAEELRAGEGKHPTSRFTLGRAERHPGADHAVHERVSVLPFVIHLENSEIGRSVRSYFRHSTGLVLMAAYVVALWRFSGGLNIALRLPHHNRGTKGSALIFGYLSHELYLNPAFGARENFKVLLKRLARQIQHLTDLHMNEISVSQWLADHHRLPNVEFNYLSQGFHADFPEGIEVEPVEHVVASSDRTWHGQTYQINVSLNVEKGVEPKTIAGELVTRDAVTPPGSATRFVQLYKETLQLALTNPEIAFERQALETSVGV